MSRIRNLLGAIAGAAYVGLVLLPLSWAWLAWAWMACMTTGHAWTPDRALCVRCGKRGRNG